MKLIFAMYCLLMLAACHKEPKEVPEEFDFDKEPAGTYFQGVINFRIQNQEGKDLLWGENRVPDEQIQVLYRENGKKKVYFRKTLLPLGCMALSCTACAKEMNGWTTATWNSI